MNPLIELSHWLTGATGDSPGYMKLSSCMRYDTLWIAITVALDLSVAAGYGLIAMHWWKNSRTLPNVPAKYALANMRNIFLFCGLCGYAFIPIKMFWPAWRLYDMFMVVLVYFTWRYAWKAKDLKVVYNELGRSTRLAADLEVSRRESAEKAFFLNAISHDIRTPLNGLMLQANLAELSVHNKDEVTFRETIAEMKSAAHTVSKLLDSFLEYGQLTSAGSDAATSAFELSPMVDGVVKKFSRRATSGGLALNVRVHQGLRVRLDSSKLERILSNLLDNALKFTPSGSVRVEAESDGSGLEIHVIDTGIGIEPHQREKLFDEFYQVDNAARDKSKGFGLGLAIARRLARKMGGDITVESAVGSGSRFTLAIPRAVADAANPPATLVGVVIPT